MNTLYARGIFVVFSMMLAACSSTDTATEEPMALAPAPASPAQPAIVAASAPLSAEQLRDQEMLALTVYHFDYDKSELNESAREALVYHARRLRNDPALQARLEGHADERGTREYNQALGERRAQAVQRYLQVQGVPSRQIETVSYGEDRPLERSSTEAAYARNRRVELKYN